MRGSVTQTAVRHIAGLRGGPPTPNHDGMITTDACEDILLGWSDGQIIDNLSQRYEVSSQQALQVITAMRTPGNCQYDENF
jgi:hypothetical protein